jgi:putative sigma-54 modulation protein
MEIQVVTKNTKIDDETKEYAEKKLSKLSKYLSTIHSIKLDLVEEKSKSRLHVYTAQATMNINGFWIRGEHREDDIRAAIDGVADVMERLVNKYKGKYEVNKGRVQESIRKPANVQLERAEADEVRIVKKKRFLVKPMTVDEAIDQIEFIGHDFFIFLDSADNSVNIIYRRKDGKYGLIQPEFS